MSSGWRTPERPLLDVLARERLGADRRAAARARRDFAVRRRARLARRAARYRAVGRRHLARRRQGTAARPAVPTPWAAYVSGAAALVGYIVLRLATA